MNKAAKFTRIFSFIVGIVSAIAASMSIFLFAAPKSPDSKLAADNYQLELIVQELKDQIVEIEKRPVLPGMTDLPEKQWSEAVTAINAEMEKIQSKLNALEEALDVDPIEALAIPIMRKDIDNNKEALKGDILQSRAEMNRLYDLNKWIIGLMFTLALGVLGVAASNFFSKKE